MYTWIATAESGVAVPETTRVSPGLYSALSADNVRTAAAKGTMTIVKSSRDTRYTPVLLILRLFVIAMF